MPVNQGSRCSKGIDELSKVLMSLSSAEIALTKAEASVGGVEAAWSKSAKVTIGALLFLVVVSFCLVMLALRGEYGSATALFHPLTPIRPPAYP